MTPMHGKPVLVYMTCGPEAEECEKLTDEQSVAFAMRLLRDIFDKRGEGIAFHCSALR